MKNLNFLLCCAVFISLSNALVNTEEEESECIDKVFSQKQSKEVEVIKI
jgi:hypothetical protein